MVRPLRIQEKGAVFHVFSRGNLKLDILAEENRKEYFLDLLRKGAQRYRIAVFAFCLMNNHYHITLRISDENLHKFMHFLGSSYANFMVRSGWVGHVFAGRYKAIRIEEEEYFLVVNRYIHLNPVEAGITERPEDYFWANYSDCINGMNSEWLDTSWLDEYFGHGGKQPGKEYQSFVENAMGGGDCYPDNEIVAQALLGSEAFLKRIKASIRHGIGEKSVIGKKCLTRIPSLAETHAAVCEHLRIADLSKGDYRGDEGYRYACALFIFLAREHTAASCRDIGELLGGIDENTISRRYARFRKSMDENAGLRARCCNDKQRILRIIENAGLMPRS
jgi:REP element-mobilizing transposase RayT